MNVLLIHTGPLQDLIFATPLIRAVRQNDSINRIHCLVSEEGAVILHDNPYIEKVYTSTSEAGNSEADYIIDLDNTWQSHLFCVTQKGKVIRYRINDFYEGNRWSKESRRFTTQHLADQYLSLVSSLGIESDGNGPDFFVNEKNEIPGDWLPEGFRDNYVVFALSTAYATRRLPTKRIIELCDRINKPVILIGNKEDHAAAEEVSIFFTRGKETETFEEGLKKLNKKTLVFNGCGKFNLQQQVSLIRQSRYVITFDNLFTAVASAFEKEIISIWGNTVLGFGRYPYNTRFTVLENNRLECRPCSVRGYEKCPLGHFKCMNDIVFDFYIQ